MGKGWECASEQNTLGGNIARLLTHTHTHTHTHINKHTHINHANILILFFLCFRIRLVTLLASWVSFSVTLTWCRPTWWRDSCCSGSTRSWTGKTLWKATRMKCMNSCLVFPLLPGWCFCVCVFGGFFRVCLCCVVCLIFAFFLFLFICFYFKGVSYSICCVFLFICVCVCVFFF